MIKRLAIIAIGLALMMWAYAAWGQTAALLIDKTATPAIQDLGQEPSSKGVYVVPPARYSGGSPVYDTKQQIVIPSFANQVSSSPGNYPAGVIAGYGPLSVLRASSTTQNLPASGLGTGAPALVTMQYFESQVAGYQEIDEAYQPANLGLVIRDCSIWGYDDAGDNYNTRTAGAVGQPFADNLVSGTITGVANTTPVAITTSTEEPKTGQRVTITGTGLSIDDDTFYVTRTGDGTFTLQGSTAAGAAATGTWTREDIYNLVNIRGTGYSIQDVRFFYCPGVCVYMAGADGGTGTNGVKRGFDAEVSTIRNCKFKRAYHFIDCTVNDAAIADIEGEHWVDWAIRLTADGNKVQGPMHLYGGSGSCLYLTDTSDKNILSGPFYLESSHIGLRIDGSYNTFSGLYARRCNDQCIFLAFTGQCNSLSDLTLDLDHESAAGIGILWHQHFCDVSGVNILCNDSGNTGISLGIDGAGAITGNSIRGLRMIGTGTSDSNTAIKVVQTMNNTYIQAHFKTMQTGLDMMDGVTNELGTGNTIILTHENCTTPLELTGWHAGAPANDPGTNTIKVNGVQWYPN